MLLRQRIDRYNLARSIGVPIRYILFVRNKPFWLGDALGRSSRSLSAVAETISKGTGVNAYKFTKDDIYVSYYMYATMNNVNLNVALGKINTYLKEVGLKERNLSDLPGDVRQWKDINMDKIYVKDDEEEGTIATTRVEYISKRDRDAASVLEGFIDDIPMRHSNFVPTSITMYGSILETTYPISPSHGLEMFDSIKVSENVPYVKYMSQESYHKLYTGDIPIGHSNIVYPKTRSNRAEFIYMTVWVGTGDLKKATKRSYAKVTIDLAKNLVTMVVPLSPDRGELQRMRDRLGLAVGGKIQQKGIGTTKGEFYIYGRMVGSDFVGINYVEEIFLEIILRDMVGLLFMSETITAYPVRSRKDMGYRELEKPDPKFVAEGYIRNPTGVTFSVTSVLSNGTEVFHDEKGHTLSIVGGSQNPVPLPRGTKYIKVSVNKASDFNIGAEFTELLPRVMSYYTDYFEDTATPYRAIVPGIFPKKEESADVESLARIDRLKKIAPDIFVEGYARVCQTRERQPEVIDASRIPGIYELVRKGLSYHNRTIGSNQLPANKDLARVIEIFRRRYPRTAVNPSDLPEPMTERSKELAIQFYIDGRQTMSYPRDNPRYTVFCAGKTNIYPDTIPNTKLKNADKYSHIPCCAVDDQSDPSANSHYNEYFKGQKVIRKSGGKSIISATKSLPSGRTGELPKPIVKALGADGDGTKLFYYRVGVPSSPNSFLHSILTAMGHPSYRRLDDAGKENMVRGYRADLAAKSKPGLYKQEMYDYTYDKIKEVLEDPDTFFDPSLFIRGIEGYFGVNVYLFEYDSSKRSAMSSRMVLPRFRGFYASPFRERKCILIIKHWGSSSDRLKVPQCELILRERSGAAEAVFDEEFSSSMYDMLSITNRSITWTVEGGKEVPRGNFFSLIDYSNIVGDTIRAQLIDSYGKVRAFVLEVAGKRISMVIPASQPENLESVDTIPLGDSALILSTFKQTPTSLHRKGSAIVGIWYPVADVANGVYFPIIPVQSLGTLDSFPEGPAPSIPPSAIEGSAPTENISTRVNRLKKSIRVLIQLVLWFYIIYKKLGAGLPQMEQLLTVTASPPTDSLSMYDLSRIKTSLPEAVDAHGAFRFLSRVRGLTANGKIVMYSDKMKKGVMFALSRWEKTRGSNPEVPSTIHGLYQEPDDFTSRDKQIVLIGNKQLSSWMSAKSQTSSSIDILVALDPSRITMTRPYLYRDPSGRVYMIQNVAIGEKPNITSAINVAYTWETLRTNIGYRAHPTAIEYPYVVFVISDNGGLVPIEDRSRGSEGFLQILKYDQLSYAAMLDIL